MAVPHGGGKRFETDSEDYQTILGWVRDGAPYGTGDASAEAKLTSLELYPSMAILPVAAAASPAGNRALQRRPHRRLHAPGALHGERRRSRFRQRRRRGHRQAARRNCHSGPRGRPGRQRRGRCDRAPVAELPEVPRFNFIDDYVFQKLRQFQIVPSDLADDSEFLRRVCLDLTGTLPPPQRVREFLASADPQKREKVIDALIASPEFVDYWTFRFADLFRVSIFGNGLSPKWMEEYWEWIRNNIETNRPYDQVARERIAAEGYKPPSRHFLPYNQIGTSGRHHGRRGPRLHGAPPRLRAVPQPSLRELEPGPVLGHGRLLLAHVPHGPGGRGPSHGHGPGHQRCGRQHGPAASAHQGCGQAGRARQLAARPSRRKAIRARSWRAG